MSFKLSLLFSTTATIGLILRSRLGQQNKEKNRKTLQNTIIIRVACKNDVPSILNIYEKYANDPTSVVSFEEVAPSVTEMEERRVNVVSNGDPYLVATTNDNRVVGYAYSHPFRKRTAYSKTTEISIYVAENMQGRGVGKMLMKELIAYCKTVSKKKSLIAVLGSEKLQTFYKRFGFRTVGCLRSVGYKKEVGWIDRWVMELVF